MNLSALSAPDLPAGKTLYVPLTSVDSTNAAVSYQASSSNASVTASVLTGGDSLKMVVTGKDSQGSAFTGTLTFRLFESLSPNTTARIKSLVNSNFYDGLTFHRIINGFVAQGGDPNGDGTGGSGTDFSDEFSTDATFNSRGLLAMANSGDDTNDSQFFIVDTDLSLAQMPEHLNFDHSIFGILTSGFATFDKLMTTPVSGSTPVNQVKITSVDVFTDTQNGVLKVTAPTGFTGASTISVIATGGGNATSTQNLSVSVVADTKNDKAFLGTVQDKQTALNTPITFTVQGIDLEKDDLTFIVSDPSTFASPSSTGSTPTHLTTNIQVTPASGNTPAFATITLTPENNWSGDIEMLIGVRDQTNRGNFTLNSRSNYDTQKIKLTVGNNQAPVANAGGPYTIAEGAGLTLNASTSSDADGDTLTYSWDVNGDGTFGDATGVNPTLTAAQVTALGITDGPATKKISVQVSDGHGHTTTSSQVNLNVTNVVPTLQITGNDSGVVGQSITFTLKASDISGPDNSGNFTYKIDWNNDGTVDETVTGTKEKTVSHAFTTAGNTTFKVTATDKDSGVSTDVTKTVAIAQVSNSNGDLNFAGTSGADHIRLRKDLDTGKIHLFLNGTEVGAYDVTGVITLDGGDGDDLIRVGRRITNPTIIKGGLGNDIIIGGMGQDILFGNEGDDVLRGRGKSDILSGGDGDDKLVGDHGRDIIIGGAGADKLHGGLRGDLMIGGETAFDDIVDSLKAIRDEWISKKPIDERIKALTVDGVGTGNTIKLTTTGSSPTVTDDGATDEFFGYLGHDWFLSFDKDQIHNGTIYDRYGATGDKKNA